MADLALESSAPWLGIPRTAHCDLFQHFLGLASGAEVLDFFIAFDGQLSITKTVFSVLTCRGVSRKFYSWVGTGIIPARPFPSQIE